MEITRRGEAAARPVAGSAAPGVALPPAGPTLPAFRHISASFLIRHVISPISLPVGARGPIYLNMVRLSWDARGAPIAWEFL